MRVGIVGGRGAFGSWCVRLFAERGHEVRISDQGTDLSNEALSEWAEVVVVTVPIGVTEAVLESIATHLFSPKLLVELTSVKGPCQRILSTLSCELLSLHPMFSPSLPTSEGQNCVVEHRRPTERGKYVLKLLTDRGISLVPMSADEHDRTMAVIQGLTHFQAIAAAHCMKAIGFDIQKTLPIASPVYRLRLDMIGRIIAQDPRLYAEIQMYNPHVSAVIEELTHSSALLAEIVARKDIDRFVKEFISCQEAFGEFTREALAESTELIEALRRIVQKKCT